MKTKITYELVRKIEGELQDVLAHEAKPGLDLAKIIATLEQLCFLGETVAHLQGHPEILKTTDVGRHIVKLLKGDAA